MQIGIVGAPNKGKSRFFSSLTDIEIDVADYPFTTINPNKGVCFAYARCPCKELRIKCNARGGRCKNGWREIPVQLLDVAGLVPGAHEGKGMGNQFLDDLKNADGFIQVIDASGRTDLEGKKAMDFAVKEEIGFFEEEMAQWIFSILKRNYAKFKGKTEHEMAESLAGIGIAPEQVAALLKKYGIKKERVELDDSAMLKMARDIFLSKPLVVAANKADVPGALERLKKARVDTVPCSAEYERALLTGAKKGMLKYAPYEKIFEMGEGANEKQRAALAGIRKFMELNGGTGVYEALRRLIFGKMKMIVVYPVEDENRYCDGAGNVLLDAILMPEGSTAIELAKKIHTDLAKKFVGAIDARTKKRVSKEYVLKDNDIIKIIAAR